MPRSVPPLVLLALTLSVGCDELTRMASDEWEQRGKAPSVASTGAPVSSGATSASAASSAASPRGAAASSAAKAAVPVLPTAARAEAPRAAEAQAPLRDARLVAHWSGGCGLVGASGGRVYGRASDCRHVLELDPATGKLETRPLPVAMLVRAVEGGAAYGCELGRSDACHLLRAPLAGGRATFVADVPRGVDGHGAVIEGAIAFLSLKKGTMGGPLVRLDLATARLTEVAPNVGPGQVILGEGATYFAGALAPTENVGSPSWGLWAFEGGAAPRSLGGVSVDDMVVDAEHLYYVTANLEVRRLRRRDGGGDELLAEVPAPPSLQGRLGVSPGLALSTTDVYVSTANVEQCQIYRVAK